MSVLATRRAISITLRGYLRAKSGGGANQGFRARIAEFTGGATQRIILALRGDLRESVTLRALVARARQILPAIEDYLYKQKGLARGGCRLRNSAPVVFTQGTRLNVFCLYFIYSASRSRRRPRTRSRPTASPGAPPLRLQIAVCLVTAGQPA